MNVRGADLRKVVPLALFVSALVALAAVSVAVAKHQESRSEGEVIVSPSSVNAGAKAKTLHFTFLATTDGAASGGAATFTFPPNWPAPHMKGSAAGRVGASPTTCSKASVSGVSHSVVTVQMTCKNTQTFTLTYGGVTVPTTPGYVTFKVKTADGTVRNHKLRFGSLRPIGTSPVMTVSSKTPAPTSTTPTTTTPGRTTPISFVVSAPSSVDAGASAALTVTALDFAGHTATGYTGTVHFTSSDGSAVLPADAHLTNGVGTFSAVLTALGTQTITVTDTLTRSQTGTAAAISVGPGPATHFSVTAPSSGTAGSALSFTVKALDQFGNTATGYSGTVHFTTSDTDADTALPADSTLTNGTGTFSATLNTIGGQTITVTDTAARSITGTSSTITVG